MMKNTAAVALVVGLAIPAVTPALAQGPDYFARQREINALRDSARAQERQADSLRRIERIERDRALREDRAQRVYDRDRRDSYLNRNR